MKHFLFIIAATLIISCSGGDDNRSIDPNENSINPPAWIQGTWYSNFDGVNTGTGFKITSNDFCTVLQSTQSCWKELIQSSAGQLIVNENSSDTDYTISFEFHHFTFVFTCKVS